MERAESKPAPNEVEAEKFQAISFQPVLHAAQTGMQAEVSSQKKRSMDRFIPTERITTFDKHVANARFDELYFPLALFSFPLISQ